MITSVSEIEPVLRVSVIVVPEAATVPTVFAPIPFTVKSPASAFEVTVSLAVRSIVVVDVVVLEIIVGGVVSRLLVTDWAKFSIILDDKSMMLPVTRV